MEMKEVAASFVEGVVDQWSLVVEDMIMDVESVVEGKSNHDVEVSYKQQM